MRNSKKQTYIKSKKNGCFFKTAWLVFICLVSALLAKYTLIGINDMLAIGKPAETINIEIPQNASLGSVANILKANKVIEEKNFFKLYARITKSSNNFNPGNYELATNMDYQSILNHLRNSANNKDIVEITFTEGMNILDYSTVLSENGVCGKNEFLKCCNSSELDEKYTFLKSITNAGERVYKVEGYLFPDTYKFYLDEKPVNVMSKILSNYQNKVIKKSADGKGNEPSLSEQAAQKGMSVNELTVIASLIQAEAANVDDMYKVSSVIHNRLDTLASGGKSKFGEFSLNILRIDATIYYPYKNKASVPEEKIKNFKSNFDTYVIEGLPPGPICNPGIDALRAALNPATTDYYYYCHSTSGEAFYAKTNEAHIANLRRAGL